MRTLTKIAGISALALGMAIAPVAQAGSKEEGEKELAKLLEGREAGEPMRCIPNRPSDRVNVIDKTAIVYGSGNTIYVQYTKHPEQIDDGDIMVVKRYGGMKICRLDNVTTIDRTSGIFSGAYFYEDFIPYTRVKKDK